jgi:hypothetical protein
METYNLNVTKKATTIKQILYNNKYDTSLFTKLTPLTNNTKTEPNKNKWGKFTYVSKETKFVTKLFKHTILNVVFEAQNTIGKLVSQQNTHEQEKYEKFDVYQLKCPDCYKKYIGQTSRLFHISFREKDLDYK